MNILLISNDQNSNLCTRNWKCNDISMTMKLTRLKCEYPIRERKKETEREFLSCKKRTLKRESNASFLKVSKN